MSFGLRHGHLCLHATKQILVLICSWVRKSRPDTFSINPSHIRIVSLPFVLFPSLPVTLLPGMKDLDEDGLPKSADEMPVTFTFGWRFSTKTFEDTGTETMFYFFLIIPPLIVGAGCYFCRWRERKKVERGEINDDDIASRITRHTAKTGWENFVGFSLLSRGWLTFLSSSWCKMVSDFFHFVSSTVIVIRSPVLSVLSLRFETVKNWDLSQQRLSILMV